MKYFLLMFILFLSFNLYATENKKSGWLGTFAKKEINQKYSFWLETQMRYSFDNGGTGQILYRTGVLQKIFEDQGLGYLYGYIQSKTLKEHRLTLQHTCKFNEIFSHRARFEVRLLEDGLDTGTRFRYLLRSNFNISNNYKFIIWDEAFLNTNNTDWNGDRFFERNRIFLGFRRTFEKMSIEFGYLNQFVPREDEDTLEHVAVLYLFF